MSRPTLAPSALAVALSVAVGALIASLAPEQQPDWVRLLPFAAMLAVSAVALMVEHENRGLRLFSPLTLGLLFYNVMFAVVPISDLLFGNSAVNQDRWWLGTWLVVCGLVSMLVGYHLAFRGPTRFQGKPRSAVARTWSPRRARNYGLLGVGVAATAALYSVGGPAGAAFLLEDFGSRRLLTQGSTPILIGLSLGAPATAILAANWARDPRSLWLLLVAIPIAVVSTGYNGQRWRVVVIIVAVLAIVHLGHRRIPRTVLISVLVTLLVAFVWVGQHRNQIGTSQEAPSLEGANLYYNYIGSTHEVGQFRDFVTLLDGMPQTLDFQYGQTFLSIIPQAPFPTGGALFTNAFFPGVPEIVSYPPSYPGELYMNFGALGVAGGMLAFGFVLGAVEAFWRRNRGDVGALAMYGFAVLSLPLVLRGDFTTFGGFFLVGFAAQILAVRSIRQHQPANMKRK